VSSRVVALMLRLCRLSVCKYFRWHQQWLLM